MAAEAWTWWPPCWAGAYRGVIQHLRDLDRILEVLFEAKVSAAVCFFLPHVGCEWGCSGGEGGGNGIAAETPEPRSLKAPTLHRSIPGSCLRGWEENCPREGSGRTFLGGLEDGPLPGTCCTGRRCLRRASPHLGPGPSWLPQGLGDHAGLLDGTRTTPNGFFQLFCH